MNSVKKMVLIGMVLAIFGSGALAGQDCFLYGANGLPVNAAGGSINVNTGGGGNANALISPRQTVTTTELGLAAPANAVGVILECESVNADNVRWGFSNAGTAILSATLGMLCEPGRDSGLINIGFGAILHLISTGVGSDFVDVQWILTN